MSFAGTYAIRSALSNNTYLSLPLGTNRLFAPVVGRVHSNNSVEPGPQRWNITAVGGQGSNLYTVRHSSGPISIVGDGLFVYFVSGAGRPAAQFSIEDAGNYLLRFHVPNEDSVWTLKENGTTNSGRGTPVTLSGDQGLTGQRWSLESLD